MVKAALIEQLISDTGVSKEKAKLCINNLLTTIATALAGGEQVQLSGFGTFKVKQRAARKGRNPQTGAVIDIPAKKVIVFKAWKGVI